VAKIDTRSIDKEALRVVWGLPLSLGKTVLFVQNTLRIPYGEVNRGRQKSISVMVIDRGNSCGSVCVCVCVCVCV
jgi:hypothetical protein